MEFCKRHTLAESPGNIVWIIRDRHDAQVVLLDNILAATAQNAEDRFTGVQIALDLEGLRLHDALIRHQGKHQHITLAQDIVHVCIRFPAMEHDVLDLVILHIVLHLFQIRTVTHDIEHAVFELSLSEACNRIDQVLVAADVPRKRKVEFAAIKPQVALNLCGRTKPVGSIDDFLSGKLHLG